MRLTHIRIVNIAGISNMDEEIPAVAIVEGANGEGKSSLTEAICYAAGRRPGPQGRRGVEHDPMMVHGNAERGEIHCTFDDPDGNLKWLKCLVTRDETTRWTKSADSTKFVKAGSNLDEYFNAIGYNPFKLKDMEPKERIEQILLVIPPPVTAEEIKEAVGGVVPCAPFPAVETIRALHDDLFNRRTDANRDADTLTKQAMLLDAAPGVGDDVDWVSQVATLRADMATLEAGENEELLRIQSGLSKAKSDAAERRRLADIEIDKEIDGKIAGWNAERATRKTATSVTLQDEISAAVKAATDDGNEIGSENQTLRVDLITRITDAEARARVQLEAVGTRNAARKAQLEAETAKLYSTALSAAIERLRTLTVEVGRRIDLGGAIIAAARPGVPVDLCREEAGVLIPFAKWNTRDKEAMCLRIALKSQGRCGLVIIDSIGNFDPVAREELRETCHFYAEETGVAFIVGSPTKGPVKIKEW